MKRLILMLQFFTRIPINKQIDIKDDDFARGTIFFPVVGLVIGMFNAGAYWIFSKITGGMLPAVISVLVNVLITGALHLDGLADTCDGVFSARKKERMLEIMKDSRIGTNGSAAIFFDLMLRVVLISSIGKSRIIYLLLIMPIVSRTCLGFLMYISAKAKAQGGLGSLFIGKIRRKDSIIAVTICILISSVISGYFSILTILLCLVLMIVYKNFILSRIDVITGDTLGAANELCEIFVLLIFIAAERFLAL